MSDKPEGPGWWIASDGKWYPPELHPSVRDQAPAEIPTVDSMQGLDGVPKRRWDDDPAKATHVGPQFPDLFQKALQGSHLADNISVKYDGEERRNSGAGSGGPTMAGARSGAGSQGAPGVGGATIGAPASKKKRRKGR
ncbi:MAG: hypothetical protein ABSC90_02155 [Acidimicrobiales bacterium]|jgi:hypothetical protein